MYQKNLQSHYNRHYGKAKTSALNSPSAMLLRNNKRMLEEDSDDEFSYSRQDQESKLKEQKLGSVMFLVTIVILLVKLFKLTSECKFLYSIEECRVRVGIFRSIF